MALKEEKGDEAPERSMPQRMLFFHKSSMCQVLPQHSSPCKSMEITADRLASLWCQQQNVMSATLGECGKSLEILKENGYRHEVTSKNFLPTIQSATWQVQKQVRGSCIWAHWSVTLWVFFVWKGNLKSTCPDTFNNCGLRSCGSL